MGFLSWLCGSNKRDDDANTTYVIVGPHGEIYGHEQEGENIRQGYDDDGNISLREFLLRQRRAAGSDE